MSEQAYQALVAESAVRGWPERYKEDLTKWDHKCCLEMKPDDKFVWVLRDMGTHIITPDFIDGVGTTGAMLALSVARIFPEPQLYYWWDGQRLCFLKGGAKQASELLRQHQPKDKRGWSR